MAHDEQSFLDFADYFSPRLKNFCLSCGLESEEAERRVAECIAGIVLKTVREHSKIKQGNLESWVWIQARDTLVDCWQSTKWGKSDLADVFILLDLVEEALATLPEADRSILQFQRPSMAREREEISKLLNAPIETVQRNQEKALKNFQTTLESDLKFRRLLVLLKRRESKQSP